MGWAAGLDGFAWADLSPDADTRGRFSGACLLPAVDEGKGARIKGRVGICRLTETDSGRFIQAIVLEGLFCLVLATGLCLYREGESPGRKDGARVDRMLPSTDCYVPQRGRR